VYSQSVIPESEQNTQLPLDIPYFPGLHPSVGVFFVFAEINPRSPFISIATLW